MSSGGDELLRAVLDKSCTYNGVAFYTIEQTFVGAAYQANVTFQGKQDVYFLVTGITPYVISAGVYDTGDTYPVEMSFYDPSSTRQWSSRPNSMTQWGDILQKQFTMPQYWLIEPASTLVLQIQPANVPNDAIVGVMLNGIEYKR